MVTLSFSTGYYKYKWALFYFIFFIIFNFAPLTFEAKKKKRMLLQYLFEFAVNYVKVKKFAFVCMLLCF